MADNPQSESPYAWEGFEPDPKRLEDASKAQQEHLSRVHRLFVQNPDGAELLRVWRLSTTERIRGPREKSPYTVGYLDGMRDFVQGIINMAARAEDVS